MHLDGNIAASDAESLALPRSAASTKRSILAAAEPRAVTHPFVWPPALGPLQRKLLSTSVHVLGGHGFRPPWAVG